MLIMNSPKPHGLHDNSKPLTLHPMRSQNQQVRNRLGIGGLRHRNATAVVAPRRREREATADHEAAGGLSDCDRVQLYVKDLGCKV